MSNGSVLLVSDTTKRTPIKVLRDMGAMQSLILKSSFLCGLNLATGEFVIIQSISTNFVSIPLHQFHLVSDFELGLIVVKVVLKLTMKGMSMLLGHELTGGKVTIYPKVTLDPVTSTETEKIEEENPGIFPSCAITRAQVKAQKREIL